MKSILPLLLLLLGSMCLTAAPSLAAPLDLGTLSCAKYESDIVGAPSPTPSSSDTRSGAGPAQRPDAIDTVMWLFGFSVANAGGHVMYGDALAPFGFALDAECKSHPSSSLLQAVKSITPKRDKPMDLAALNCGDFESRHAESARTDPVSANTIMMWLFGFSVGRSGDHRFDPDGVLPFAAALHARCTQNPNDSLFDALTALAPPAAR
jgi:hypothetical protein